MNYCEKAKSQELQEVAPHLSQLLQQGRKVSEQMLPACNEVPETTIDAEIFGQTMLGHYECAAGAVGVMVFDAPSVEEEAKECTLPTCDRLLVVPYGVIDISTVDGPHTVVQKYKVYHATGAIAEGAIITHEQLRYPTTVPVGVCFFLFFC